MKNNNYRNLTILLIAVATVLRLLYIWQTPLDLTADEAQYWDWARRPLQACYLTKPPMVAYTISFFTGLGGSSTFFVRLGAVVISVATSLVAYLLIVDMFKAARLGFLMVLTLNLGPIFNVGSIIMTIDPLAMLFWSLTMYFSYKALKNPHWWYLAGLSLGLGMLSKFVLIFLPISILLYLLFVKKDRSCLKTKEPYLALLLSLLIYTPVLLWNNDNNWCYFGHMLFGHMGSGKGVPFYHFVEFLGSQLLMLSPLLFTGVIWSLVVVVRERNREGLFLFFCTAPILLFFFLLSVKQKVQGNWPVVGYFAGIAVFVSVFGRSVNPAKRKFMRVALVVALIFSAVVYILPFVNLPRKLNASAGQGPVLFYKANGAEVSQLEVTGIPLGIMADFEYAVAQPKPWGTGDIMMLLTDGFYEWTNPAGNLFGADRAEQILRENADKSAQKILQAIRKAVMNFAKGTKQNDDLTGIIIKRS